MFYSAVIWTPSESLIRLPSESRVYAIDELGIRDLGFMRRESLMGRIEKVGICNKSESESTK